MDVLPFCLLQLLDDLVVLIDLVNTLLAFFNLARKFLVTYRKNVSEQVRRHIERLILRGAATLLPPVNRWIAALL
jgi:hypothetical protein